jgi:putative NADH-flavin reductase
MKIIIFGSTGKTGIELLRQALEKGHHVTAFARSPEKLADIGTSEIEVARGDVLDQQAVGKAISGQEAVISTIGAGSNRTTLREDGTRNIVHAMEGSAVRRFISLSSMGVGDSWGNLGLFTKYVVVSIFLRHAFADHKKQEAVIKRCSLDWIIVRPPHLKDGPRTGIYKHGIPPTDRSLKGTISRADVADFMLKQLADDTYLRKAVGISY